MLFASLASIIIILSNKNKHDSNWINNLTSTQESKTFNHIFYNKNNTKSIVITKKREDPVQTGTFHNNDSEEPSIIKYTAPSAQNASSGKTNYSKQVRQNLLKIKSDWQGAEIPDPELAIGSFTLLGKIKSSSDITEYLKGTKENPLSQKARGFISEKEGIVTLGQSLYQQTINNNTSRNNSGNPTQENTQQSLASKWGTPGIIRATIQINNGNMQVGWGGNNININYLGSSSLVEASSSKLVYDIGDSEQRVIIGMDTQIEELLVKNSPLTGLDNEWYEITLEKWVKDVRLADGGWIEIWNNDNPVMKFGKPEGIDSTGSPVESWWSIEQIEADEVTSVIKPGCQEAYTVINGIRMVLKLVANMDGAVFPVVIDPAWSTAGNLGTGRRAGGIFQLGNGKILIAGGFDGSSILSTCELYDPSTGAWSSTGSLSTSRWYFAGVVNTDGKVILAGGYTSSSFLRSCEIFDPGTATWSGTGSMQAIRSLHTVTLLDSSNTILASGGWDGTSNSLLSCEKWTSDTWALTGSLNTGRRNHATILLQNSKVLVIGGDPSTSTKATPVCELFDASANTWALTGSLNTGRRLFAATMLTDGNVVAFSGRNSSDTILSTCEKYNTSAGTWTLTGSITTARSNPNTTMLPSGKALVTGGYDGAAYVDTTELFDSTTFSAGTTAGTRRVNHHSVIMYDGHVLLVGGQNVGGNLSSTEYYRDVDATWTATGSLNVARRIPASILLNNGKVLCTGGLAAIATTELYDPSTGTWVYTGSFTARQIHILAQMQDGKVMAIGGWNSSFVEITSCELYDVSAGTWSGTGSLNTAIAYPNAVVLTNGNVLVSGGYAAGSGISITQLYDDAAGTWSRTGSMTNGRYYNPAIYLSNGKVLSGGGIGSLQTCELYNSGTWTLTGSLNAQRALQAFINLPNGKVFTTAGDSAVSELYDVSAGTWVVTGSLSTTRQQAMCVLMANGKVLIAGGNNAGALSSCEVYDPVTGTWTLTGSLAATKYEANIALLPTGKVLVIGGYNDADNLSTCSLYNPIGSLAGSVQPTITSVEGSSSFPVNITISGTIDIVGTNFKGKTQGSSGRLTSSPANFPIVMLKRVVDGESIAYGGSADATFIPITSSWTASTSLTFTAPSGLQSNAYYQIRVIVNGIASDAKIVKAQ